VIQTKTLWIEMSKAMKSFLERLAGGRSSFRGLGMGEAAALSLSKGMRRGQVSPVNKPLKKQAREPWNERNGFRALPTGKTPGLIAVIHWSGQYSRLGW